MAMKLYPLHYGGDILKLSENRVLRRIFRLRRNEVTASLRGVHNEELYNLYSSPCIKINPRRIR
jgi:hypothetical protein